MNTVRRLYYMAAGDPSKRSGYVDPKTGARRTKPWMDRTADHLYSGLDGSVWMYRVLENVPLRYEDGNAKLDHGRRVQELLEDIGRSSVVVPSFIQNPDGYYREIHVLTIRWDGVPEAPPGTPTKELARWMNEEVFHFDAPQQAVFIGIKLRQGDSQSTARDQSFVAYVFDMVNNMYSDDPMDFTRFERDRRYLQPIFQRNHCRQIQDMERRQLEAWFNNGSHTDPEVIPYPDNLLINREAKLEFFALQTFNNPKFSTPHSEWVSDVMDHEDGPSCVSIRAYLQPSAKTRKSLKTAGRDKRRAEREREKVDPDGAIEEREELDMTHMAESMYAFPDSAPSLFRTTIIFGHRQEGRSDESWIDFLRHRYAIDVKPLIHHQMNALESVQPAGQRRPEDFPLHLSTEMVSYAGVGAFSAVGDDDGAFAGLALPDRTQTYFNFLKSSEENKPPVTFIGGVPGSGKTFLSLALSFQAALGGLRVAFVNPKGFDSLSYIVPFMESYGIRCETTRISRLFNDGGEGMFDPFRFAEVPETAATMASNLITTVLTFDQEQRTALAYGLKLGAKAGCKSTLQALEKYVTDETVKRRVMQTWESNALFAICIGKRPRSKMVGEERSAPQENGPGEFMLTEFDVDINLPVGAKTSDYSDAERIALASIRAITTAQIGMLAGNRGGVFVMDEAHNVLGHPETVHVIQRIMREGRSLNVAQIYLSQLVSDLLKVGASGASLESYITRVFALAMYDEKEAAAALKLLGYEPTRARIEDMRTFGPERLSDGSIRPALGYFRDLYGRKSPMMFGPFPAAFANAASTNVLDRRQREESDR